MRLNYLKLKNYRQFKEAEIEFSDGVVGIVGLNGVGKSTLVEAVGWALFGNLAARTEKEGIKRAGASAASEVEVALELEIDGSPYRITRKLKGTGQTGEANIEARGKMVADSVKGADKEISYLLGMDYKSFYTSFFAKQKELNALSDLTPNQRKDIIIRMLRIDAVDRVIDHIRSKSREAKLEAEILRKNLKDENIIIRDQQLKEKELRELEKEHAAFESECKKLENALEKIRAEFMEERKSYEQFNRADKQIAQLKARLTGLKKREEELLMEEKEIGKLEKEFEQIKKDAEEYELLAKQERELSVAKSSGEQTKETRLADLRQKYKKLEEREKALKPGQPCPTCGQEIKDLAEIKKHLKEQKEESTKLAEAIKAEIPYDKKGHDHIREQMKEKEKAHLDYPKFSAKLERKNILQKEQKRITEEIKNFETELTELTSKQEQVPYDEKKHEKITLAHNEIKAQFDHKQEKRNTAKVEIASLKKEIEALNREIENRKATEDKIKELIGGQEQKNRLSQIMTDFRTHLISRIRPQLSDAAGLLFAELTDGKYSGIELDENYEMHIFEGGAKYALPRFSGGEADLANLCLRLAISQLISGRSNIQGGFLILDEIFGSQDPLRKNSILAALARLAKRFRQIIVITHVDDIKDSLESIIEVREDENGISHAKQY